MLEAPLFRPLDADFRADRYRHYDELRARAPAYWYEEGPTWVLSRYDDVETLLRVPEFTNELPPALDSILSEYMPPRLDSFRRTMLLFRDPPVHRRLRGTITKAFTPRVIDELRPTLARRVGELLDAAGTEFDLVPALASPLPALTVCELLGVPGSDRGVLHEWSYVLNDMTDVPFPGATIPPAAVAADALFAYLEELVAERRRRPGQDLCSALIAAEDAGERLSHDEVIGTLALLLIAGHDTTVGLIANGAWLLLRHPEELARLRADPALVPSAIEEMLRYEPTLQLATSSGRFASRDVEFSGVTIPAGQRMMALIGAANRDPAVFPEPHRFDVGRTPNRHLAFGKGMHACIGAALARAEGQVVLQALLDRTTSIEQTGPEAFRESFLFRQVTRLPVRLAPR